MRRSFTLILLSVIFTLSAYEYSMLNLSAPSGLKKGEAEFMIRHRFYGDIADEPLNNFFGMDAGANINLSCRYQLFRNAEVNIAYSRRKSEKVIGVSYLLELEDFPIYGQINLDYFSFEEKILEESTRRNFLYLLSLQNEEFLDNIILTLNTGFDGYYERFLLGLGLKIGIVDNIGLIGEYYPVLDRNSASAKLGKYIGEEDAFAFGIKLDTYGHHFIIMLSNTDDIGLRGVSLGTIKDSHLRFGFNIQRKFVW